MYMSLERLGSTRIIEVFMTNNARCRSPIDALNDVFILRKAPPTVSPLASGRQQTLTEIFAVSVTEK